uniref:Uncharacterized protein n=1 Tax=Oryza meridionalis TaxID=40149 RepID=A0A0E0CWV5_9ORYZ
MAALGAEGRRCSRRRAAVDDERAGASKHGCGGAIAIAVVVRGGALGDGDDELTVGVGGGDHGEERAWREAKSHRSSSNAAAPSSPSTPAERSRTMTLVTPRWISTARALAPPDGVNPSAAATNRSAGVGGEQELEHLGEDVQEPPQLLPFGHPRRRRSDPAPPLHGDGVLLRRWVHPHGRNSQAAGSLMVLGDAATIHA